MIFFFGLSTCEEKIQTVVISNKTKRNDEVSSIETIFLLNEHCHLKTHKTDVNEHYENE